MLVCVIRHECCPLNINELAIAGMKLEVRSCGYLRKIKLVNIPAAPPLIEEILAFDATGEGRYYFFVSMAIGRCPILQ